MHIVNMRFSIAIVISRKIYIIYGFELNEEAKISIWKKAALNWSISIDAYFGPSHCYD